MLNISIVLRANYWVWQFWKRQIQVVRFDGYEAKKVTFAICNLQFLGTGFTERLHMRLWCSSGYLDRTGFTERLQIVNNNCLLSAIFRNWSLRKAWRLTEIITVCPEMLPETMYVWTWRGTEVIAICVSLQRTYPCNAFWNYLNSVNL